MITRTEERIGISSGNAFVSLGFYCLSEVGSLIFLL